jgi:hypothetical protein
MAPNNYKNYAKHKEFTPPLIIARKLPPSQYVDTLPTRMMVYCGVRGHSNNVVSTLSTFLVNITLFVSQRDRTTSRLVSRTWNNSYCTYWGPFLYNIPSNFATSTKQIITSIGTDDNCTNDFTFILSLWAPTGGGPVSYLGSIGDLKSLGLVCKSLLHQCHNSTTVRRLLQRNLDVVLIPFGIGGGSLRRMLLATNTILGGEIIRDTTDLCEGDNVITRKRHLDMFLCQKDERLVAVYLLSRGYTNVGIDHENSGGYFRSDVRHVVDYVNYDLQTKVAVVIMNDYTCVRCRVQLFRLTFMVALYDGRKFELWFPQDIMTMEPIELEWELYTRHSLFRCRCLSNINNNWRKY